MTMTPGQVALDVDSAQTDNTPPESASSSSSPFDASSPEVGLQMRRVWKTVGEILIPDNAYCKSSTCPDAETTLNILSAIASLPTKSTDPNGETTGATMLLVNSHRIPTASAFPIVPSAIQVITAALVLTLLEYVVKDHPAPADDGYVWMPQNTLKATLKNNPWALEALSNERVDWVMKTMLKVVPTKLIVLDRKRGAVRFGKE